MMGRGRERRRSGEGIFAAAAAWWARAHRPSVIMALMAEDLRASAHVKYGTFHKGVGL